jgi:hypothetical protein
MNIKQITEGKPTNKKLKLTFFDYIKMYMIKYKKTIVYILIISLLLFPKQYGNFVGNWINDFFVTIYKKTKQNINETHSTKYIQNH